MHYEFYILLKDGISLGSIYAIIALGYTMVYGIAKMLNLHMVMLSWLEHCNSYRSYQSQYVTNPGNHSSVVICTVAGVVIEAVAYRPLRKASSNLAVLITAIGVSYLLQNLALLILAQMQRALFRLSMFRLWSCLADSLRLKVLRS